MKYPEDVFVDTSAWIALINKDDEHHKRAAEIYPELLKSSRKLITTNLVLSEAYILIVNELSHKSATTFLKSIKTSPRTLKVYSTEEIEEEAEKILIKYKDHKFSYTDAVSFAVMKKQNIKRTFTFDAHFSIAGFEKIP